MLDDAKYIPRLRAEYDGTIRPALMEEFGYTNAMTVSYTHLTLPTTNSV